MNKTYKIYISGYFKKHLKPYTRKFKHLKYDVMFVIKNFNKNYAISLGNHVYKIRLTCSDLKKGKNKSFRIIILIEEDSKLLIPINIYFKSTKKNISQREIDHSLSKVLKELNRLNI